MASRLARHTVAASWRKSLISRNDVYHLLLKEGLWTCPGLWILVGCRSCPAQFSTEPWPSASSCRGLRSRRSDGSVRCGPCSQRAGGRRTFYTSPTEGREIPADSSKRECLRKLSVFEVSHQNFCCHRVCLPRPNPSQRWTSLPEKSS